MSTKLTRLLVVANIVVYAIWFLLPQVDYKWLSEDAIVLLGYTGLEATIPFNALMSWSLFVVTLLVYVAILIFDLRFRYIALFFFAVTTLLVVPTSGVNVETGLSLTLRDLSSMLIGALVISLFFRPHKSI